MNRNELDELCHRHGLIFLGLVDLAAEVTYPQFSLWLEKGQHAEMRFLENNQEFRKDPRGLLDGSIQALIFAISYNQGDRLLSAKRGKYRIAQYARLRDYHKTMRGRALRVLSELEALCEGLIGRVTVDSAPLLERALASKTSSGFIGKNTCYIHPDHGSLILIGEILLNQSMAQKDFKQEIDPKSRSKAGGCGSCTRCQVNCPTGALAEDYVLDARKCLAYWTIEHRGTIPFEFWPWIPTYVFGCDLCQLACPYNRGKNLTKEAVRMDLLNPDLFDLATMSQVRYETWLGGSPLTRAKRHGLRRNALIALAVTKDHRLDEAITRILPEDPNVLHETIQQIRIWMSKSD